MRARVPRIGPTLGLLAALLLAAGPARAIDGPSLKAAFIYNFGAFTTWPAGAHDGQTAMTICVDTRVDPALLKSLHTLEGKPLHGLPVRVQVLAATDEMTDCAILVMSSTTSAADAPRDHADVGGNVLTVCDCPAGDDVHAMFHLVLRGTRLQFEVARGTAAAAGFVISSRLLRLASTTR